jgi:membrane-associated phospholipid phosphatase
MHQLELAITLFLQNLGPWLAPVMKVFTAMGQVEFYMLIVPLIYWCIEARYGLQVGAILLVSSYLNVSLKLVFHLPRPYWIDPRIKAFAGESSFGMPSGHAQNAASTLGLLAIFTTDRLLKFILLIFILLIGFSRIFLGVHFTSDVVIGWIVGGLLLFLFLRVQKPISTWFLKHSINLQIIFTFLSSLFAIIIASLLVLSHGSWKQLDLWAQFAKTGFPAVSINPLSLSDVVTASGMWFGFISGAAWFHHKYGTFNTNGAISQKIFRYILGLTGLAVIYILLGIFFPGGDNILGNTFRFVRFGLVGVWITAIAPMFFIKANLARLQMNTQPVFDRN